MTAAVLPIFGGDDGHGGPVDPAFPPDDPADPADPAAAAAAAGGGAVAPDLSARDLLPLPQPQPRELVGGGDGGRKPTFAVVAVQGGRMPSASSKFVGATPKAAAMKAARRVHKRCGSVSFEIVLRRVAARKVDKKLYKYRVEMTRRPRPRGFVTLVAPRFVNEASRTKSKGSVEHNVAKKVAVVTESAHPAYGHLGKDGVLQAGAPSAAGGCFKVVRAPGTNTLSMVIPGALPDAANGVRVVKTEWDVSRLEETALTGSDRVAFDIAGKAKMAAGVEARRKAESAKAAAARRRDRARAERGRAKAAERATRERARKAKAAAP